MPSVDCHQPVTGTILAPQAIPSWWAAPAPAHSAASSTALLHGGKSKWGVCRKHPASLAQFLHQVPHARALKSCLHLGKPKETSHFTLMSRYDERPRKLLLLWSALLPGLCPQKWWTTLKSASLRRNNSSQDGLTTVESFLPLPCLFQWDLLAETTELLFDYFSYLNGTGLAVLPDIFKWQWVGNTEKRERASIALTYIYRVHIVLAQQNPFSSLVLTTN